MANTKMSALTALTAPAPGDGLFILDDYGGSPVEKMITLQNMFKVINGLTEDTGPDRTAGYVVTCDTTGLTIRKVLMKNLGAYVLPAHFASTNPADGTTYYFGCWPSSALGTSATNFRIYIPRAGIITAVDVYITPVSTGSNETSTLYLRLNNTTDTTISSTIALNANPYHELKTGLSVSVAAGDYVEMKWVTPTWATNPTDVWGVCNILVS